ncbi:hypothetical protein B0H12DRAFT_421596 [Mycena haematopus]|nr:hypothetical protein B0H12DRAFT_421596 [Mycena haematopus]
MLCRVRCIASQARVCCVPSQCCVASCSVSVPAANSMTPPTDRSFVRSFDNPVKLRSPARHTPAVSHLLHIPTRAQDFQPIDRNLSPYLLLTSTSHPASGSGPRRTPIHEPSDAASPRGRRQTKSATGT